MTTAIIDNKVKQVVSNIRNLPTPPIVFHQIQKVINQPTASAADIASILAEDPAMSVKVLKLTNSAFYGLAREIESVKEAVVIVGMEAIKNLVLSASVLDMFKGDHIDQEYQEKFWRHSLATGFCSRLLARKLKKRGIVDADAAFSAGLLHDVGKIVIACFLPAERKQYLEARAADRETLDHQMEDRLFGYTHAQVGAFLAAQWKLPRKLGDAIGCHHTPQLTEVEEPIAYIVSLGNYISKYTFFDKDERFLVGPPDQAVLDYMQVTRDDLAVYGDLLKDEYLKAETFMKMAGIS